MSIFLIMILLVVCSVLVISVHNPIYAILALMLNFGISFILFLFLGAEFIAILILIIYIGAISILFLFIIMMLNLRLIETQSIFLNYLPIGSFLGLFLFIELIIGIQLLGNSSYIIIEFIDWAAIVSKVTNIEVIGIALFNFNWLLFFLISLILFLAMIGAIVIAWKEIQTNDNLIVEDLVKINLFFDIKIKFNYENSFLIYI